MDQSMRVVHGLGVHILSTPMFKVAIVMKEKKQYHIWNFSSNI